MARKKVENAVLGTPWLNTFADLMNLLLCFFIILFALSDVNGEKFEKISISMANSIGVFEGGGSGIGEGQLISSGMSQLNELDEMFNSMGKSTEGQNNPQDATNSEQGLEDSKGAEGVMNGNQDGQEGSKDTQGTTNSDAAQDSQDNNTQNVGIDQAMAAIQKEKAEVTSGMYDQVSDLSDQYNLGDSVELSMDPENNFVELTLKGSILFDSGSADIKKEAKPILTKVGELLKNFDGQNIEITGHTDNIPMNDSDFKDNNWLSSARALNAAEYLINVSGLDPSKLKYSGRGEYEPISSNATAEGRAKNRRIEIKIFNEYSQN